jgi:large subunit ribosomal protein L13
MKSVASISKSKIEEKWYLVDAEGKRIGLIASKVAELLLGKANPLVKKYHNPNVKVVVINAEKIDYTPKRGLTKFYKSYSGFPDGLRFRNLDEIMKAKPELPIVSAVKGMLPRTKRGDEMIVNLKVFAGSEHPHQAQKPEVVNIKNLKL